MLHNELPPGFLDSPKANHFKNGFVREDIDVRINLDPGPDMIQKSAFGLLRAIMNVNSSYVSLSAGESSIQEKFTSSRIDTALDKLAGFFSNIPQKPIRFGEDVMVYQGIDMKDGVDADQNPMNIVFANVQGYDPVAGREMVNQIPLAHLVPTEDGMRIKNPTPGIDSANIMFEVVTFIIG